MLLSLVVTLYIVSIRASVCNPGMYNNNGICTMTHTCIPDSCKIPYLPQQYGWYGVANFPTTKTKAYDPNVGVDFSISNSRAVYINPTHPIPPDYAYIYENNEQTVGLTFKLLGRQFYRLNYYKSGKYIYLKFPPSTASLRIYIGFWDGPHDYYYAPEQSTTHICDTTIQSSYLYFYEHTNPEVILFNFYMDVNGCNPQSPGGYISFDDCSSIAVKIYGHLNEAQVVFNCGDLCGNQIFWSDLFHEPTYPGWVSTIFQFYSPPTTMISPATPEFDTICIIPCTNGHYTTPWSNICNNYTVCSSGQYISREGTNIADRQCSSITACPNTHYISKPANATSDNICTPLKSCLNTEYEFPVHTPTTDRTCNLYSVCDSTHYQSVAPSPTTDRECALLRTCSQSEYESKVPSPTSNRECTLYTTCGSTQYISVQPTKTTDLTCSDLTECTIGVTYQTQAPSPSANRICSSVKTCKNGEFEVAAPTLIADRQCRIDIPCDSNTQYEISPLTATSSRVCLNLTICNPMTQYQFISPTTTTDRKCEFIKTCPSDQYAFSLATPVSQTICHKLTTCQDGITYETAEPTATSDRFCSPVTTCQNWEYVRQSPSIMKNVECANLTVCSDAAYQSTAPTPTTDRKCSLLRVCNSSTEYETTPATASSNRACASLTVCNQSMYETRSPTPSGDRHCAMLTVCNTTTEYEHVPATRTSNRICIPVRNCVSENCDDIEMYSYKFNRMNNIPLVTSQTNPTLYASGGISQLLSVTDLLFPVYVLDQRYTRIQIKQSPLALLFDNKISTAQLSLDGLTVTSSSIFTSYTSGSDQFIIYINALTGWTNGIYIVFTEICQRINIHAIVKSIPTTKTLATVSNNQNVSVSILAAGVPIITATMQNWIFYVSPSEQTVDKTPTSDRECITCPVGYIDTPQDGCVPCEPGSAPIYTNECEMCPIGKYAPMQGTPECYSCPAGTTASEIGSCHCDVCPAGTFAPMYSSVRCDNLKCPLGTSDSDKLSASPCSECPIAVMEGLSDCVTSTYAPPTASSSAGSLVPPQLCIIFSMSVALLWFILQ